jgi:hypothetical protein
MEIYHGGYCSVKKMNGREKKEYNDLFFVCSLIEYESYRKGEVL